MFRALNQGVLFDHQGEKLLAQAWGAHGVRIRATRNTQFADEDWALLPCGHEFDELLIQEDGVTARNGNLRLSISAHGKLKIENRRAEAVVVEKYRTMRRGQDIGDPEAFDQFLPVNQEARMYRAQGRGYRIAARFEAFDGERIYGMGQYQQSQLNLKGCVAELAQYNTQVSVPFMVSSRGYGLLWNNPGIGRVVFGENETLWDMELTQQIDYWVTVGDTPAEILENYTGVTGRAPMMPEYGMGFWQCKLRYRTQEELLSVARQYHRRGIPLDVIVIDFFHWTNQGDWKFDPAFWPDPAGMARELGELGVRAMVSVWPTVDSRSENMGQMRSRNLLVQSDRGIPIAMNVLGQLSFADFTNPQTRAFVWEKCRQNYMNQGISLFWLDVAEPEYSNPDFDIYRYCLGPAQECANIYPMLYAKCFADGLRAEGEVPLMLIRSAWAGSQRYGALAWSGDIPSTFTYLRYQIAAGLNMGMAGIPWWNSDIGGFNGGDVRDPAFIELLIRWFEFAAFCPVMRLHGNRNPQIPSESQTLGGGLCGSGADNEVWSYGAQAEAIFVSYIRAREAMKPYTARIMREASETGAPVMRPLFFNFPGDPLAWRQEDSFLFGGDLLVAPVYKAKADSREVYLPAGARWQNLFTGEVWDGGQTLLVRAPLSQIPLFARAESDVIPMLAELKHQKGV